LPFVFLAAGVSKRTGVPGFEVRCQIIWAKNTFAWGFGRYKFQHEPLFYAHVAGQKDPWYGDKSQSTFLLVFYFALTAGKGSKRGINKS
jgi:hypothetical protein